ncbi:ribose 5-phosphate isomerase B [Candidatus Anaplasma sp. TIGMIC]|uniref:ribose 5-phosphate isomerase B n=1 Tax=Candidatus Anaplasma sp. TIGMIC TaxID=3020713 RepID=UPI00232EA266|nr:ribose 5-phosphate isomerase B [Candidatus Anaplasma sp. TIGMIC]MDB1135700.1 ribose 5-phosphate isomerase B [Candidatus Anaplasma sp. TIGMIC]
MLVVKRVLISSDHAGVELRLALSAYLESIGCAVTDYGCDPSCSAVDYPDYVHDVVQNVSPTSFGVLVCGTGIGMSIAANRNRNIRAALCFSPLFARLAREHNDANVLCFGSRYIELDTAKEVLHTFVSTKFLEGRHMARVMKLM